MTFDLAAPSTEPVYDSRVPDLAGIRWPECVARRPQLEGEIAMFDVEYEGELQQW